MTQNQGDTHEDVSGSCSLSTDVDRHQKLLRFELLAGVFLISFSLLSFEMLLTRIFSVTMWYHFSFLAISIAMFGMTIGGIALYIYPGMFPIERTCRTMAVVALIYSLFVIVSSGFHFLVPSFWLQNESLSALTVLANFLMIALPFVCAGICIALALTRWPASIGSIYAVDLIGAGLASFALVPLLDTVDASEAIVLVAVVGALSSVLFAKIHGERVLVIVCSVSLLLILCFFFLLRNNQTFQAIYRPHWEKGMRAVPYEYERWNSFSRVTIEGKESKEMAGPFGWGISSTYRSDKPIEQKSMTIDGVAATPLTKFDGSDVRPLEHLKYDVTNIVHHLRKNADVLAIGVGGGRDLLSALVFDQKSVTGVEYNSDILYAIQEPYSEFVGNLSSHPKITLVNEEARSYLNQESKQFDIIQISLIDTWAATAAGAFVFAENALYTKEAWELFLERLSERGLLSVSRWYHRDLPAEMYRLAALAGASLSGQNASDHTIIIGFTREGEDSLDRNGVGTLLLSVEPFSEDEVSQIHAIAEEMKFKVLFSPKQKNADRFEKILSMPEGVWLRRELPLDISPPTDDRPFFFHMLRAGDALFGSFPDQGYMTSNVRAVGTLWIILLLVVVLTALCIVYPLRRVPLRNIQKKEVRAMLSYFLMIGLGFMFLEIGQLQRFNLFLGHPMYGLSVVLFTFLIGGGLGSLTTVVVPAASVIKSVTARAALFVVVLGMFYFLSEYCLFQFRGSITTVRIIVSVLLLLPLAVCLGMFFPLGVRIADSAKLQDLVPWFWGVNGAASVCASVVTMIVTLYFGISATLWVGFGCYLLAFLFIRVTLRSI